MTVVLFVVVGVAAAAVIRAASRPAFALSLLTANPTVSDGECVARSRIWNRIGFHLCTNGSATSHCRCLSCARQLTQHCRLGGDMSRGSRLVLLALLVGLFGLYTQVAHAFNVVVTGNSTPWDQTINPGFTF